MKSDYYFGTSAETDAYTVAIQLPVILFSVVSTAISTIIIPNYSKELYGKGEEQARRYASNFMTSITLLTVGVVAICEIFAEPIMKVLAPGLDPEINSLAANLFRIVLPTIVLTELMNINSGILELFGLSSRLVSSQNEEKLLRELPNIDYDSVQRALNQERKRASEYLSEMLTEITE